MKIKNELSNAKTWHDKHKENLSLGQKIANSLAKAIGSWLFIIIQTVFVVVWMVFNIIAYVYHWDPYPFILLNLLFSTQAAYSAPIIIMAQNRQNDRDRFQAAEDYKTNVEAKQEVEEIQRSFSRIESEKIDKILNILENIESKNF